MSAEYEGKDPMDIARQAERDHNSSDLKGSNRTGRDGASDSSKFYLSLS